MAPALNPPSLLGAKAIAGPTPPNLMDMRVAFNDRSEDESGFEVIARWSGGSSMTQLPPAPGSSTERQLHGVVPDVVPEREYRITMRSWKRRPDGSIDQSPESNERVSKMPKRVWPLPPSGSRSEAVTTAQYLLRHHGADIVVDGEYGPQTQSAVAAFNRANGLGGVLPGGHRVLGSATWEKLIVPVQRGSQGDPVRAVQSQLASRGMNVIVDGDFGSQTEAAVKTFQRQVWLTTGAGTGIVDAGTWSALVNGQPLPR
jgi:peptidoglycan hydrolase-like protein with peptidoglycan-binding domain